MSCCIFFEAEKNIFAFCVKVGKTNDNYIEGLKQEKVRVVTQKILIDFDCAALCHKEGFHILLQSNSTQRHLITPKIIKILLPIALFFTAARPVKAETQLFNDETGNYVMSCLKHNQSTICQIQKVETKEELLTINLTDQELTKEGSLYCFKERANHIVMLACYDKLSMPNRIGITFINSTNGESTPNLFFSAID